MHIFEETQNNLSTAQAIPLAGPLLISPIKGLLSSAQIITGLCLGIFLEFNAIHASLKGRPCTAENYTDAANEMFTSGLRGGVHLIYACANFATFGILGLYVEISCRRLVRLA